MEFVWCWILWYGYICTSTSYTTKLAVLHSAHGLLLSFLCWMPRHILSKNVFTIKAQKQKKDKFRYGGFAAWKLVPWNQLQRKWKLSREKTKEKEDRQSTTWVQNIVCRRNRRRLCWRIIREVWEVWIKVYWDQIILKMKLIITSMYSK